MSTNQDMMTLNDSITVKGLKRLGFVKRPDLIEKVVEDCWCNGNLIIYRHQNSTEWHVQVGHFIYPAILPQEYISTYRDLQSVYRKANNKRLSIRSK